MKNIEKYQQYESIIDKIADDFCMSFFPDGIPEYMYDLSINHTKYKHGYYIRKAKVKEISYRFTGYERKHYYNKKPSNVAVFGMKQLSMLLPETINQTNVFIHFQEENSSWAKSYDNLITGELSTNKDDMEVLLIKEIKYHIDNYVLKENQFSCSYCWEATDNDKKISKEIFSGQFINNRKSFDFCSTRCAVRDQMAHEG